MSEVSSNTPKRQAIVNRLRQRIDSFRKHHDTCVARLEETQQSQELKQQQESRIIQSRILENKNKMNSKMRHDQVSIKIPKQEEICSVGQEKPTSNTGLQPTMKRRGEFPPSQIDGERNLPTNEDLGASVPRKYPRFENPNDIHCNLKPPNFTSEGDPLPSTTKMVYPTVNGHNGEFPKSEELSKAASSYSGAMCENIDRTMTRASQQYGGDFASTFTNHGQSSVSDKSRTADFPVNFKQENGLINPGNDGSTSITNGFTGSCTKSENLPEYHNTNSKEDLKLDLKSQISQFERVLQDIKNRDENSSDSESKNDLTVTKNQALQPANPPLGNGLGDNHEVEKGSNQLGLSNGPNNGTQLPTASTTTSTAHQQHGISRSTAEALHQFIRDQQEEKQATKIRYERTLFLNSLNSLSQGVGREQNSTRMTQRANPFPPIRQRVFEQIQQRRTNQQKSKLGPQAPQLHARNPVMNPMGPNSPYQMHQKVRYPNIAVSTAQPVTFSPTGRVQQSVMPQIHQASSGQQQQAQAQLQNLPRHLIAQQKMAFQQQQMASRLPSYAHAQHLTHPSPLMGMRQKFTPGIPTSHSAQYPLHQQVARTPQPLSHLQHYPNAYPNQGGPPSRPVQPAYTGDYSGYQNPYAYSVNQENKLHSAYQRHTSVDDNLASSRYNQDTVNRNNFSFQRSSSVPGHANAAKHVFNQTSPLVRLGQAKPTLPDMNNNGNEHQSQELGRSHTQPPLTHVHMKQTNNLTMNQELYQRSAGPLNQSRSQTTSNLQQTFSNSFSNLLDLKPNSDSSLFPFFGNEISGGSSDNADFDSLLKSPPSDFDLLNILESEPSKALQ